MSLSTASAYSSVCTDDDAPRGMWQVKLWVVVVVVPAVVSVVSVVGLAGFGRVADRCSVRGVGAAWLNGWRPFLRLWPRTPSGVQPKSDSARLRLWLKSGQFQNLLAFATERAGTTNGLGKHAASRPAAEAVFSR